MPIVAAQRTGYFITCSCSAHKDSPWARWNMIIQICLACTHACTQTCTDTHRDSLRDSPSLSRFFAFIHYAPCLLFPHNLHFKLHCWASRLLKKHFFIVQFDKHLGRQNTWNWNQNPTRSYGEQGSFFRGGNDVSERRAIKGRNVITKWNTGTRDPGWKALIVKVHTRCYEWQIITLPLVEFLKGLVFDTENGSKNISYMHSWYEKHLGVGHLRSLFLVRS